MDVDAAWLYGVSTKALIQAVRRNAERFPHGFMFKLENGTAFTVEGLATLSTVLRSRRAAQMNIAIIRILKEVGTLKMMYT